MLLCGTFLFIWWVMDLFSCQTVNTIILTHICSAPLAFPFTQMPACLRCSSDPTSSASEPQQNWPPLWIWNFHKEDDADNLTTADLHQGNIHLLQDSTQKPQKAYLSSFYWGLRFGWKLQLIPFQVELTQLQTLSAAVSLNISETIKINEGHFLLC